MSKSVSVEEAIKRIEKNIEENRIEVDASVIRAVPTGPTTPIPRIPNDSGITTLASPVGPVYAPPTFGDSDQLLTIEELIEKLESETEESLYQEFCEKYTRISGHTPDPTLSDIIKNLASLEHLRGQYILNILKAPRVQPYRRKSMPQSFGRTL